VRDVSNDERVGRDHSKCSKEGANAALDADVLRHTKDEFEADEKKKYNSERVDGEGRMAMA